MALKPWYKVVNLEKLPIPRISFTIPDKERKKKLKEAIGLYADLKSGNILRWAENELSENKNDTIHDLLVYLAEQMIEMNKKNNEEVKGFLK